MNDEDPTYIPAHLRPVLLAAAKDLLVMATERGWHAAEEAAVQHELRSAARVVELMEADACSPEQVGRLAKHAVWQEDLERWPRSLEEADALLARVARTRDLIILRDLLGAQLTEEELNEPA